MSGEMQGVQQGGVGVAAYGSHLGGAGVAHGGPGASISMLRMPAAAAALQVLLLVTFQCSGAERPVKRPCPGKQWALGLRAAINTLHAHPAPQTQRWFTSPPGLLALQHPARSGNHAKQAHVGEAGRRPERRSPS